MWSYVLLCIVFSSLSTKVQVANTEGTTDRLLHLENLVRKLMAKQAELETQLAHVQVIHKTEMQNVLTKQQELETQLKKTNHKNSVLISRQTEYEKDVRLKMKLLESKCVGLKNTHDIVPSWGSYNNQNESTAELTKQGTESATPTASGEEKVRNFKEKSSFIPSHSNFQRAHIKSKRLLIPATTNVPTATDAHVAFHATFQTSIKDVGYNEHLEFNRVLLNEGDGYNGSIGTFICSVPGLYFFSVTLLTYPDKYLQAEIVRNGDSLGYLYCYDTDHYGSASNSILVRLNAGDAVWVRVLRSEYHSGTILYPTHSTFTGFLLYK